MEAITREEARAHFKDAGLTYSDIREGDILALVMMLNATMKRTQETARTPVQSSWHLSRKIIIKKNSNGTIRECYLFVNAHYFTQRECISFNRDGFIGFCGWAGDENIPPILNTFCAWVDAMAAAQLHADWWLKWSF